MMPKGLYQFSLEYLLELRSKYDKEDPEKLLTLRTMTEYGEIGRTNLGANVYFRDWLGKRRAEWDEGDRTKTIQQFIDEELNKDTQLYQKLVNVAGGIMLFNQFQVALGNTAALQGTVPLIIDGKDVLGEANFAYSRGFRVRGTKERPRKISRKEHAQMKHRQFSHEQLLMNYLSNLHNMQGESVTQEKLNVKNFGSQTPDYLIWLENCRIVWDGGNEALSAREFVECAEKKAEDFHRQNVNLLEIVKRIQAAVSSQTLHTPRVFEF